MSFFFDEEAFRTTLMAKFAALDEARRRADEKRAAQYREEAARSQERLDKSFEAVKESLARFSALFAYFAPEDELFFSDDESVLESLDTLDPVVPIPTGVYNCSGRTSDCFSSALIDEVPSSAFQQISIEEEQQIDLIDPVSPFSTDGSEQGALDRPSSDQILTLTTSILVVPCDGSDLATTVNPLETPQASNLDLHERLVPTDSRYVFVFDRSSIGVDEHMPVQPSADLEKDIANVPPDIDKDIESVVASPDLEEELNGSILEGRGLEQGATIVIVTDIQRSVIVVVDKGRTIQKADVLNVRAGLEQAMISPTVRNLVLNKQSSLDKNGPEKLLISNSTEKIICGYLEELNLT
jgi:hypothetical protein